MHPPLPGGGEVATAVLLPGDVGLPHSSECETVPPCHGLVHRAVDELREDVDGDVRHGAVDGAVHVVYDALVRPNVQVGQVDQLQFSHSPVSRTSLL